MGASGWTYIIDYEPSLEDAFSKARWEIFRSGQYYKRPAYDLPSFEIWIANYPPDMVDDIGSEGMVAMYAEEKERNLPDPTTPDEALIFAYEDGTHSLIDCMKIEHVSVYSDGKNEDTFGTTTPTLEQIEDVDLDATLGRHSFCVVVAYEGEEKRKYVFFGVSGD